MIYVYAYELTTRTVFLYDVGGYKTKWNDGKPLHHLPRLLSS